jgi:hypothetical protein
MVVKMSNVLRVMVLCNLVSGYRCFSSVSGVGPLPRPHGITSWKAIIKILSHKKLLNCLNHSNITCNTRDK